MEAVTKTPEREAFYKKIDGENLSALWNVMGDLITPEPRSACRPHLWKFDAIRDYMTEAGKLITAKEAERRVLILENPGLRGQSKVTTSLFAGVQMVIPGDVAPAHRHSQSALRFVLEGKGSTTSVDGEQTVMEPGDFVITPSMTWHDHANQTNEPMFWLDGLDIPMVQFFDASFAEASKDDQQKISRPPGDSFARFGHNLLPVDVKRASKTSPIFNYPYAYTRDALEKAKRSDEWDACHGLKLKYTNPATGDLRCRPSAPSSSCCRRVSRPRAIAPPTRPCLRRSKAKAVRGSATRCSNGARATCSWCRAGSGSPTKPTKMRYCLVFRIARSSRSWICSERIAGMRKACHSGMVR